MDFTREPIIESVITPKEGCTLVVRSSKSSGQEEHFVDAVEVVTFGNAIFFRSRERPKAFLVPVTDYEILEVRETRLLLKNVGIDRAIKIAGGREAPLNAGRDVSTSKAEPRHAPLPEKQAPQQNVQPLQPQAAVSPDDATATDAKADLRLDKKRDRRRNHRRRRGKEEDGEKSSDEEVEGADKFSSETARVELPAPHLTKDVAGTTSSGVPASAMLSSLLSPPPNLISETIARYKDNVLFKGAFFSKEDDSVGFNGDSDDEDRGDVGSEDEAREREREGHEPSSEYEAEDHSNKHVIHEVMSEQEDEIHIPEMSLDYPVYGSGNGIENAVDLGSHQEPFKAFDDEISEKSPGLVHHVPSAAGYVPVDEASSEVPFKEDVFSGFDEAPVTFKAIPEEHFVLPIEQPFFDASVEDELPSVLDNPVNDSTVSKSLEGENAGNESSSEEDKNNNLNGAP